MGGRAQADVEWRNTSHFSATALLHAAKLGHNKCVRLLLGLTPVNGVGARTRTRAVRFAVAVDASAVDASAVDASAVDASATGTMAIVLARCGEDARRPRAQTSPADKFGMRALAWAAFEGHASTVASLLEAGAEIEARANSGWTALMFAANKGKDECVGQLIEAGASVEVSAEDGRTPLMWAAFQVGS